MIAAVALLTLLAEISGGGDYRLPYRNAIRARDRGQWEEAIRELQAAIALQPAEGGDPVLITGLRREPYLPHYYLGVAYFETGNCPSALAEWKVSEKQGKIRDDPATFQHLRELRDRCPQPQPQPQQVLPVEKPPLKNVEVAPPPQTVQPAAPVPAPVPAVVPAPVMTPQPVAAPAAASDLVNARRALASDVAAARGIVKSAQKNTSPRIVAAARDTARVIRRAQDRGGDASLAEIRDLRDAVARSSQQLLTIAAETQPQIGSRPTGLYLAAAAYFMGDYNRVITLLAAIDESNHKVAAQEYLFRAAANYSLSSIEGASRDHIRQRIADDVRRCRTNDSAAVPDAHAFTPAFVSMFNEIAKEHS